MVIGSITAGVSASKDLVEIILKAHNYFAGEPFTIRIDNFNASVVLLVKYALDDREKASRAIIPEFFIRPGATSTSIFSANRLRGSTSTFLYSVVYDDVTYSVVVKYEWVTTGTGFVEVLIDNGADMEKSTRTKVPFFMMAKSEHPDGLGVTVMATGQQLLICFGDML